MCEGREQSLPFFICTVACVRAIMNYKRRTSMRTVEEIKLNIEALRQEIKYAQLEGQEYEVELMLEELDELQEELWSAQTR